MSTSDPRQHRSFVGCERRRPNGRWTNFRFARNYLLSCGGMPACEKSGTCGPGPPAEFHRQVDQIDLGTGLWKGQKGCTSKPLDRKSTRLNSSHLGISYAVF